MPSEPLRRDSQDRDEFDEEKFFGFAKSYLSDAFPNPQRIGCPADSDLQSMAEHPIEARDAQFSEHITSCSPCFRRYMEFLANLRSKGTG